MCDPNARWVVGLPWFRHAYMPSWLRSELVRALTKSQWSRVHDVLMGLLSKPDQIPLQVTTRKAMAVKGRRADSS
jgi:hypothetical protein